MIYAAVSPRDLRIDTRELASRLGAPIGAEIEGSDTLLEQLLDVSKPAYTATRVKLKRYDDGIIVGNLTTSSRALGELCRASDECILLVATLGVGVDRLVLRAASKSARDAFILDAMADALIEALCDYAELSVCAGFDTSGRFSPGYADLELAMGREILLLTDAERTLGIKLSESGLMVPKKSVNAIIAIRNKKE